MPNWCTTAIEFYSHNEIQIQALHNDIYTYIIGAPHPSDGTDPRWIGRLFRAYEMNTEDYSCRGFAERLNSIAYHYVYGEYHFTFYQYDAWAPHTLIWRDFISQFYPDIDFVFRAEESGMDVYINTDARGIYFPDQYILEGYIHAYNIDESEYFKTEEDVIAYCRRLFPKCRTLDSIDKIVRHGKSLAEKQDEDSWFNIYEYEYSEDR